jgi:hypothetical protein
MKTFTPPPQALRKAKLDNLVLVPASLLPLKGRYQAIANQEVAGTTLIVLPASDSLPPPNTGAGRHSDASQGTASKDSECSSCANVRQ